jgi:hypothetical protein
MKNVRYESLTDLPPVGSLWFPREEYIGSKIHGFLVDSNGFHVPGAFRLERDMTWVLIAVDCAFSMTELTFIINEDTKAAGGPAVMLTPRVDSNCDEKENEDPYYIARQYPRR